MLNSFRLSVHTSSYYLGLFDERAIKLRNTGYPERFFKFHHAVARIGAEEDERQFDIIFIARDGAVDAASIAVATEVLQNVVEMDDAARSLEPDMQGDEALDHDERLARILIRRDQIRFRYFATTLNSEWNVAFERNADGAWTCLGIAPD